MKNETGIFISWVELEALVDSACKMCPLYQCTVCSVKRYKRIVELKNGITQTGKTV